MTMVVSYRSLSCMKLTDILARIGWMIKKQRPNTISARSRLPDFCRTLCLSSMPPDLRLRDQNPPLFTAVLSLLILLDPL